MDSPVSMLSQYVSPSISYDSLLTFTRSEVEKHSSNRSCWVIIQGNVYDLTTFLDVHPGGAAIILKYAGKDATAVYEPLHPSDAITKHLTPESVTPCLTIWFRVMLTPFD